MSVAVYVVLAISLAVSAFCVSMLGIGGGVLYTPIQIFFGIGIHEAATTSLFLIVILSISATSVYRHAGKIDWCMAIVLEVFAITGGLTGGYFSDYFSQKALLAWLTAIIVIAGISMLRSNSKMQSHHEVQASWYHWNRKACGEQYRINMLLALPLAFLAGAIGAMVGIGGGIIKVPMMVLLFGIPMDIAVATSGFMVGITAVGGFAGHVIAGHWHWQASMVLAPGVFFGAWLGAHTMLRLDKAVLKKIFGIIMFLIALGVVIRMCV